MTTMGSEYWSRYWIPEKKVRKLDLEIVFPCLVIVIMVAQTRDEWLRILITSVF